MYAPNPQAGLMVSGSADEHIRIWDMDQKIISKYISIQRPTDKQLLQFQNLGGQSNLPKYVGNGNKEDEVPDH